MQETTPEPSTPRPLTVLPPGALYREMRQVVFLVAGLILAYQLAGPISAVLLLFLMVFILAAVLNPVAAWLQSRGIPRMVSAIGLVVGLLALLALLLWLALPPVMKEVSGATQRLGSLREGATRSYAGLLDRYPGLKEQLPAPQEVVGALTPRVGALLGRLGGYAAGLVTGVVSVLILLLLVIYTVGQPEPLVAGLLVAVPEAHREKADRILRRCMEQLKQWALGSMLLGLIVGLCSGIGLYFLGVPYSLVFGIIAGVGELLPAIGPILSSVPPIVVALTIDPMLALYVAVFYIVLQQVENNVLVPLVLGGTLNLHPTSVIFALLVMNALLGLVGALLAVPVAVIVKVVWEELYLKPKLNDRGTVEAEANSIVAHGT